MKKYILLIICIFILAANNFCQCTQPGLKIQSPLCDSARNLVVDSITSSELFVKWVGNKNQAYTLKAFYIDPVTNKQTWAKTSEIFSDMKGNFTAKIYVGEGSNVSWSVQAVCSAEKAIFYSVEVSGENTFFPLFRITNEIIVTKAMNIYPNPSRGYLIVECLKEMDGNIHFRIYDASGKQVFSKRENNILKTNNRYQLDLLNLVNGLYLLEVNNGKNISTTKFEILRN